MGIGISTGVGFGGLSVWLTVKYVRDGRVGRDNGLSVKMLLSPSSGVWEFAGPMVRLVRIPCP